MSQAESATKEYMPAVVAHVRRLAPGHLMDAPSGLGWLKAQLGEMPRTTLDGMDLFEDKPAGYTGFWKADLDAPLPCPDGAYDMFVSCEGIEHLGNPLLFLSETLRALKPGGHVVITTPNVWGPASRIKYLTRGFFPGFPSLAGKIVRGTHMHIMPFSFPWLFLFLRLAGYENVRLVEIENRKGVRLSERPFGWLQRRYCMKKAAQAATEEERTYWQDASTDTSIYGRRLVVTGTKPAR